MCSKLQILDYRLCKDFSEKSTKHESKGFGLLIKAVSTKRSLSYNSENSHNGFP